MAMIIPLLPILLVLSQVLSFKSPPRAEESIDEYAFYRYFAHKTVYLIRSCAGARRFEIFSREGCRTCTSWSRLVRGVRFAWYTTEVIRSLDIGILIYVTIDRSLHPSDPLWPLPPSFSSFSDISLRFSTLPKSTSSCAHPLSMLLESRTPLIQGLFRERLWSRGLFTKRTDADCSATFSSAKIYSFAKYAARECRC